MLCNVCCSWKWKYLLNFSDIFRFHFIIISMLFLHSKNGVALGQQTVTGFSPQASSRQPPNRDTCADTCKPVCVFPNLYLICSYVYIYLTLHQNALNAIKIFRFIWCYLKIIWIRVRGLTWSTGNLVYRSLTVQCANSFNIYRSSF